MKEETKNITEVLFSKLNRTLSKIIAILSPEDMPEVSYHFHLPAIIAQEKFKNLKTAKVQVRYTDKTEEDLTYFGVDTFSLLQNKVVNELITGISLDVLKEFKSIADKNYEYEYTPWDGFKKCVLPIFKKTYIKTIKINNSDRLYQYILYLLANLRQQQIEIDIDDRYALICNTKVASIISGDMKQFIYKDYKDYKNDEFGLYTIGSLYPNIEVIVNPWLSYDDDYIMLVKTPNNDAEKIKNLYNHSAGLFIDPKKIKLDVVPIEGNKQLRLVIQYKIDEMYPNSLLNSCIGSHIKFSKSFKF